MQPREVSLKPMNVAEACMKGPIGSGALVAAACSTYTCAHKRYEGKDYVSPSLSTVFVSVSCSNCGRHRPSCRFLLL